MAVTNSYADVTHVQAHLNALGTIAGGLTIGAASVPTTTQVEGFLDQVAAEIDGLLAGQGYTTPATGTTDILLIRRYLSVKVAAMTFSAGFMSDNEPTKVKEWRTEYKLFITRIINKQMRLVDQSPRVRGGVILASRFIGD